jgi:hypothetical protein
MSLQEVANATGAAYRTVAEYAQKMGWTQNGKQTLLDEKQVTALIEVLKMPKPVGRVAALQSKLQGVETSMSTALRLEMLYRQIDAIKEAEILRIKTERDSLQIRLSESEKWYSVKRVLIETGKEYSWKPLKAHSLENGYEIEKVFDQNYGEVNSYHIDVWHAVYGLEL